MQDKTPRTKTVEFLPTKIDFPGLIRIGITSFFELTDSEEMDMFMESLRNIKDAWFKLNERALAVRYFIEPGNRSLTFYSPFRIPHQPFKICSYLKLDRKFWPEILIKNGANPANPEIVRMDEEPEFFSCFTPLSLSSHKNAEIHLKILDHDEFLKIQFGIVGEEDVTARICPASKEEQSLLLSRRHFVRPPAVKEVRTLLDIREFNRKKTKEQAGDEEIRFITSDRQ